MKRFKRIKERFNFDNVCRLSIADVSHLISLVELQQGIALSVLERERKHIDRLESAKKAIHAARFADVHDGTCGTRQDNTRIKEGVFASCTCFRSLAYDWLEEPE